jgi:hypothetical protein
MCIGMLDMWQFLVCLDYKSIGVRTHLQYSTETDIC